MSILDYLVEATKEQSKLRLAIAGPSGSGKTFSSINILMHMGCEKIAVLDTEQGSAAKYANEFPRKFKVIDNRFWKSNYDPRVLIKVLQELGPHVDGIVVDSLTHFWMGPGGMLSLVNDFAKQASRGGREDSFGAWRRADPIYMELVQTILNLPCHFAAGLRAKSEYEDQVVDGKKKKVKVGLAAQMRDGFEYEFDVEGQMTMDHEFIVGKTRCRAIDCKIFPFPGANIAEPLLAWLTDGVEAGSAPQIPVAAVAPVPNESDADARVDAAPPAKVDIVADTIARFEKAESFAELQGIGRTANPHKKTLSADQWKRIMDAFNARKAALELAATADPGPATTPMPPVGGEAAA